MLYKEIIKVKFTYLRELFNASVLKVCYPDDYTVYKINVKAVKYWLINYKNEWKVVGDLKISQSLKKVIIQALENDNTKMQLNNL